MPGPASIGPERVLGAVVRASRDGAILSKVGTLTVNVIKRMLSHHGSGVVYGRHQASAPGEPPAVDTGQLRNSIDYALGVDAAGGYVDVGTNQERGPWLEYGTSRMAARPFMRPALAEVRPLIEATIAERIIAAELQALSSLPREIILPD